MRKLIQINTDAEGLTNTDAWWTQIDEIRSKISDYNFSKGLKSLMGGAWTYDKLVQNAIKKGYVNADCLSIEDLIYIADNN